MKYKGIEITEFEEKFYFFCMERGVVFECESEESVHHFIDSLVKERESYGNKVQISDFC